MHLRAWSETISFQPILDDINTTVHRTKNENKFCNGRN